MKNIKEIFRRKTSLWLFLELVLVTIACWWTFDPILVYSYVKNLPMGYDPDRMVQMTLGTRVSHNNLSINSFQEERYLLEKVKNLDGVEMVEQGETYNLGFENGYSRYLYNDKDSILVHSFDYPNHSKLFQLYKIESITPGIPTREIADDSEPEKSVVLTRSAAMALYGSIDVTGQTIWLEVNNWNEEARKTVKIKEPRTIRAVVENVRNNYDDAEYCIIFICNYQTCYSPFIVRLCDGVNAERFVEQCKNEMKHDLITEQFFINTIKSSREQLENELNTYSSRDSRRNMLIAAFFICNLTFGVIGTLLMYTRQRREEAGIKMAFGATRLSVYLDFLREAWLITTISVMVGSLIFFQYLYTHGIDNYVTMFNLKHEYWFQNFWPHVIIVFTVVYLIILCTVLIGTAIPAFKIINSKITEALHDNS